MMIYVDHNDDDMMMTIMVLNDDDVEHDDDDDDMMMMIDCTGIAIPLVVAAPPINVYLKKHFIGVV
jgi:hypothetical protein